MRRPCPRHWGPKLNAPVNDPRMPVTLLTGFLGAGKTTLLNAVLSDASTEPVAVIVNEFGEAGLDHDLITSSSDEIILMESGCLCCSIRGDLAQTVTDLLIRRAKGELKFERLVIETTGLADPGPILQTLVVDGSLSRATRMDGVVTVVDAANGHSTLNKQFEAVAQVAMADLIILSKTDLALPTEVADLHDRIKKLNETARIEPLIQGAGAAALIWNISAMRRGATKDHALSWTNVKPEVADPLAIISPFVQTETKPIVASPHDNRIGSASIILDDPIPIEAFDLWLDTLIALRGPDILRVKGIVFLEDVKNPFVFHGVQQVFDRPMELTDWQGDTRQTRIVVIARDMSRPELQQSLEMLRARVPRPAVRETH